MAGCRFAAHAARQAAPTLGSMNSAFSTSAVFNELEALAKQYGADLDVLVTPDVQAWCKERNVAESNPFRCGKALRYNETGRHLILLADPVSGDMHASALSAMEHRGNLTHEQLTTLRQPGAFVKHLVLHEVAHALDSRRTEDECDEWALTQLGLHYEA